MFSGSISGMHGGDQTVDDEGKYFTLISQMYCNKERMAMQRQQQLRFCSVVVSFGKKMACLDAILFRKRLGGERESITEQLCLSLCRF